jgi:hypothetical protein
MIAQASMKNTQQRQWLYLSALMIGLSIVVRQVSHSELSISSMIGRGTMLLSDVLVYTASLEVLKECLKSAPILDCYQYNQNAYTAKQTKLLAIASSLTFGLGVSSFFKGLAKGDVDTKAISEGMTASMLLYPTTLASSYIYDDLGLSSLSALFLAGLPIAILMLLPITLRDIHKVASSSIFRLSLALAIGDLIYLFVAGFFVVGHITLKQSFLFLFLGICLKWKTVSSTPMICWKSRGVLAFLASTGVLGYSVMSSSASNGLSGVLSHINLYLLVGFVIVVIPMVSLLFMHPLVLFIMASPIVSPLFESYGMSAATQYVIWITMIINAQLLSPVSLTTILSASNENRGILVENLRRHGMYALKLSALAYVWIGVQIVASGELSG